MNKLDIMSYIICAVALCYGAYLAVQNVRLSLANEKVRKEYLNKHKDGYTMVNQYLPYMIFFLGFSVIGIIGIFVMEKNMGDELHVCFTPVLMAVISAGMTFDSVVKRWAIVGDGGFVYEKTYYRFRSILSMDPTKSTIRNIDTLITECQHIVVPKKMGAYLYEYFLVQKKRKKNKNK